MITEKFDRQRKKAFLDLLRKGVRRSHACKKVGISRTTLHKHIEKYPHFREKINDAEMDANELVEDSLFKAALNGNVTAQQVWLYNRDPETWRDQRRPMVSNMLAVKEKLTAVLGKIEAADNLETAMLGVKEAKEYMDQLTKFGLATSNNNESPDSITTNITLVNNPQFVELRTTILKTLEEYPQAYKAILQALS